MAPPQSLSILYTMRLFSVAPVLGLVTLAFSYTVTYNVSYDTLYDHGQDSLDSVVCSTGEYGLLTEGYTTFNSLPTFPYIGSAPQIMSWSSRYCGTCWKLTYTDPQGVSTCINITAIDDAHHDHDEFKISLEGMNHLTHGQATSLGKAPITAVRLPKSSCGL